ncbi:MAM and LDL-receptor class A domain-containing protein 1-like [Bacillus rossius redtenbacheri]|uniref:MAM and LDL-receptor class A domain-containing protein 1-like n=1 Tax=Bacillus rossius redtenbacheri TaxID=93214 RepID=UPI002FDD32BA
MKRNNIHKLDLFCVTILFLEIVSATARGERGDSGDSGGCGYGAVKGGPTLQWAASGRAQWACDPGSQLLGAASSGCVDGRWQPPVPVCVTDRGGSRTRCDFEPEDLCGWARGARVDPEGGYSWRRRSGATPSRAAGTGPLFDHTLGPGRRGHYLYIESSTGKEGDTASLYSPVFSPALSNHSCVYFWYHMYGATTGSLRVYVRPESAGQDLGPVFQLDGHQEDAWLIGFFPLNGTDEPFQASAPTTFSLVS